MTDIVRETMDEWWDNFKQDEVHMNDETEPKEFRVEVSIWVRAEDANDAMQRVQDELNYLGELDNPLTGFRIDGSTREEDQA